MYIRTEQERKHGRVNLIVTMSGAANLTGNQLVSSVFKPGATVHLTYSRLVKDREKMNAPQTIRSIVASFDLGATKIHGAFLAGTQNIGPDYDLSDFIHVHYVRNILGGKSPADMNRLYGNETDSQIVRGLFPSGWEVLEKMLLDLRRQRIELRRLNPRSEKNRVAGESGYIDQAISHMASKVSAVMNQILYWGDDRIFLLSEK